MGGKASSLKLGAENGDLAAVQSSLERGVSANTLFRERNTALHLAAAGNHAEVLSLLIDSGAEVDAQNIFGETALMLAVKAALEGGQEAVEMLIRRRADVNMRDLDGTCALHHAVPNHGITSFLLEHGARTDLTDKNGDVALVLASRGGHYKSVLSLVEHGADLSVKGEGGNTILHFVCTRGDNEAVSFVLSQKSCDANAENDAGDTALHIAAAGGHRDLVTMLLQHGAKVEARNQAGETPFLLAVKVGRQPMITQLMEEGLADAQATAKGGLTALHLAALSNRAHLIKPLIDLHVKVDTRDEDNGCTPLHLSAQLGFTQSCEILLDNGASIDSASFRNGATPLHLAALTPHRSVIKLLLARGADEHAQDSEGSMPWQYVHRDDEETKRLFKTYPTAK